MLIIGHKHFLEMWPFLPQLIQNIFLSKNCRFFLLFEEESSSLFKEIFSLLFNIGFSILNILFSYISFSNGFLLSISFVIIIYFNYFK